MSDLFSFVGEPLPIKKSEAWKLFEEFHDKNPHVYALFKSTALRLIERGVERSSARLIYEQMRWESIMTTESADRFKMNDHHMPFYVRVFLEEYPEHDGLFELRMCVADR